MRFVRVLSRMGCISSEREGRELSAVAERGRERPWSDVSCLDTFHPSI